jgi:hypothetical protein
MRPVIYPVPTQLRVEVRLDPAARRGDLVGILAALVLGRARRQVQRPAAAAKKK